MDSYKKLFTFLERAEPPHSLTRAVLASIELEQERVARKRRMVFGALSLSSLLGAVPALGLLLSDIATSGMFQYLTLLSDTNILFTYGKEFAFSLAESIPTLSAALFLTLCTVGIWSLAQTLRYRAAKKVSVIVTL